MNDARKRGFSAGYLAGLAGMPIAMGPSRTDGAEMCLYNGVLLPKFRREAVDSAHDLAIMKLEATDMYVLFDTYGNYFANGDNKSVVIRDAGNLFQDSAYICHPGETVWTQVDIYDYAAEDYYAPYEWTVYAIGKVENLIWSEEDIPYLESSALASKGSEPIPYDPGVEKKLFSLGCRLGFQIRQQMGKGQPAQPAGALLSSDGYILTDSNGIYITAKEDA